MNNQTNWKELAWLGVVAVMLVGVAMPFAAIGGFSILALFMAYMGGLGIWVWLLTTGRPRYSLLLVIGWFVFFVPAYTLIEWAVFVEETTLDPRNTGEEARDNVIRITETDTYLIVPSEDFSYVPIVGIDFPPAEMLGERWQFISGTLTTTGDYAATLVGYTDEQFQGEFSPTADAQYTPVIPYFYAEIPLLYDRRGDTMQVRAEITFKYWQNRDEFVETTLTREFSLTAAEYWELRDQEHDSGRYDDLEKLINDSPGALGLGIISVISAGIVGVLVWGGALKITQQREKKRPMSGERYSHETTREVEQWLGVTLVDQTLLHEYQRQEGAIIQTVESESAAEKAGLQAGDIIYAVQGRGVTSPVGIHYYLKKAMRRGKVNLQIRRYEVEMNIQVTLRTTETETNGVT